VPTLKGLSRWLYSLRALTRTRDTVDALAAEARARLATQEQIAADLRDRLGAQGQRLDELAARLQGVAANAERHLREEVAVRDGVRVEITALNRRIHEIASAASAELAAARQAQDDALRKLTDRVDVVAPRFPAMPGLGSADTAAWFHASIEATFRGPYDEIRERMRIYLPYLDALPAGLRALPALDVGCGRGEWLELVMAAGMKAVGVDDNAVSVERCVARGLDAVRGDALDYLRRQPEGSHSVVSAFHVVEHLDPAAMMALLLDARRVLADGGLLLLETPNPENLRVAGYSFRFDPTHRHPIPAPLLRAFVEFAKYEIVDALALQPDDAIAEVATREQWPPTLAQLLAGARDSALIARKPS
jgi:O-antigen chain-terminating methyltransferase